MNRIVGADSVTNGPINNVFDDVVVQWIVLCPHSKKVRGLNPF